MIIVSALYVNEKKILHMEAKRLLFCHYRRQSLPFQYSLLQNCLWRFFLQLQIIAFHLHSISTVLTWVHTCWQLYNTLICKGNLSCWYKLQAPIHARGAQLTGRQEGECGIELAISAAVGYQSHPSVYVRWCPSSYRYLSLDNTCKEHPRPNYCKFIDVLFHRRSHHLGQRFK